MGLDLSIWPAPGIKAHRDPNVGNRLVRLEQSWSKWQQSRLQRWREFDELEGDIRCGVRPARSHKVLIYEQNVRIFITHSCIGAVPMASL